MSSFAQKKLKTQATRKKTKKRKREQEGNGIRIGDEGCEMLQAETSAAKEMTCESDRPIAGGDADEGGSCKGRPRFVSCASFSGTRAGYIYKLGPCGLGYYRDGGGDSSDDDAADGTAGEASGSEGSNPSAPEPRTGFKEDVEVFATAEESLQAAVEFFKSVRAADGRQKAAVVVIADGERPLSRLPPKFGIPQVKVKAKSRKGIGSATKSKFGFAGTGILGPAAVAAKDKEGADGPEAVIKDWRSGKISTVFASDDAVPLLAAAAGRTQVLIQVTRFPSLAAFRRRREVLLGQYGNQAGSGVKGKAKASACFFSGGSASGAAADAAALAQRLKVEGQEVSDSLLRFASESAK